MHPFLALYCFRYPQVPGFAEGVVKNITGNGSDLFVLDNNGKPWVLKDVDWNNLKKDTVVWKELKCNGESLDLASISACDGYCVGIGTNGHAYFIRCGVKDGDYVAVKQDLGMTDIKFVSGSGSYTAFLGPGASETENVDGDNDDSKPAAIAT